MMTRTIGICAAALVLGAAAPALADILVWGDGDPDDHNWASDDNWDMGHEPTSSDDVYLGGAGAGLTDVYSSTATCWELTNADHARHDLVIHDGARLDVTGCATLARYGSYGPTGEDSPLVEVHSGGRLDVGDELCLSILASTTADGELEARLVNRGVIDIGGFLCFSYRAGSAACCPHGTAHLEGGEVFCDGIDMDESWPGVHDYMNITEGALYIRGDVHTLIDGYVANGWIEAYGGAGWIQTELVTLGSPKAGPGEYTKVTAVIPEPSALGLIALGALGAVLLRRQG